MTLRLSALLCATLLALSSTAGPAVLAAGAQASSSQSSSSVPGSTAVQVVQAPSLVDPAGPTISLVSSEPVFAMAAALNACGYDDGLEQSDPIRLRIREEVNQTLAKSEAARNARDKVCLYIAQHRMTGSERDISQYISLALYLSPPPDMETTVELPQMPPDSTQVVEVLPLLRAFVQDVDLHGIWLTLRRANDELIDKLHDPLSKMIVDTNFYLKMPASTYDGRRFVVVVEPLLSPAVVNARVYGTDYVVVVSPANGQIRMGDVRHTYLHYIIEPLLYSRATAIDRMQPILKEVHDAPMEFRYRSDSVTLAIECLIKAIEARTMDTGIPAYKIPAGVDRSQLPRYERERQVVLDKMEAVRVATVRHDMTQGFVLTQYFYEQLLQFEKEPASLRDSIGEMVYGMDIDQQVHHARNIEFDQTADSDVLQRSKPRLLSGLDLAEARLADGDIATASAMARQELTVHSEDTLQSVADQAKANFILARAAILTGHPGEAVSRFQRTLATSKDPRQLAWSHIYLGRMLDLQCKRDEALAEYQLAMANRDGAQDTRLAAERGVKSAYAVHGHSCEDEDDADGPDNQPAKPQKPAGVQLPAQAPPGS
ncbi:MAG TPA: hypothetical protein VF392_07665 [Terracidiphilus sp.]